MVGKRKIASRLPPRLYEYKGKRKTTYYTVTRGNQKITLGHDLIVAKKKLFELENETVTAGTVAELLEDYLKDELRPSVKAGHHTARTLKDREEQLPHLTKAFGKMHIADLTSHDVWQYLHKFRGVEAPVRANKEISFLQVAYSWAKDQHGTITVNPCTGVKRNKEVPRDRLVSDIELINFMKLAKELGDLAHRHALAFMIAYLTGKGQAQILKLTKFQMKDEGISFGSRKGGAATLVEWTQKLRDVVKESQEMPSTISTNYVVHTQTGGSYTSDGFKKGWQTLMGKWVEGGKWKDETDRAAGERFTFHDSRAKSVTTVIESGRKASELTGHKLESTVSKVYDRRAVRKAPAAE